MNSVLLCAPKSLSGHHRPVRRAQCQTQQTPSTDSCSGSVCILKQEDNLLLLGSEAKRKKESSCGVLDPRPQVKKNKPTVPLSPGHIQDAGGGGASSL